MIADPRSWLEEKLGPLASFEHTERTEENAETAAIEPVAPAPRHIFVQPIPCATSARAYYSILDLVVGDQILTSAHQETASLIWLNAWQPDPDDLDYDEKEREAIMTVCSANVASARPVWR